MAHMLLPATSLTCASRGPLLRKSLCNIVGSRAKAGVIALASKRRLSTAGSSNSNSSTNGSTPTAHERISDYVAYPGSGLADSTAAAEEESITTKRRGRRRRKQLEADAAVVDSAATTAGAPPAADKPTFSTQLYTAIKAATTVSAVNVAGPAAAVLPAPSKQRQQSVAEPSASVSPADAAVDVPTAAAAAAESAASSTPADIIVTETICDVLTLPTDSALQFQDAAYTLRDYQVEAIHKVLRHWKEEQNGPQLVMLPTGCGKTVIFAALARYMSQHYIPGLNLKPLEGKTAPVAAVGTEPSHLGRATSAGMPIVAAAVAGDELTPESCSTVAATAAPAGAEVDGTLAAAVGDSSAGEKTAATAAEVDSALEAVVSDSSPENTTAAAAIIPESTAPASEQPLDDADTSAAATSDEATPKRSFRSWRMKRSQPPQAGAAAAAAAAAPFQAAITEPAPAAAAADDDDDDDASGKRRTSSSATANGESHPAADTSCTAAADVLYANSSTSIGEFVPLSAEQVMPTDSDSSSSTAGILVQANSGSSSTRSSSVTSTLVTDEVNDNAPSSSSSSINIGSLEQASSSRSSTCSSSVASTVVTDDGNDYVPSSSSSSSSSNSSRRRGRPRKCEGGQKRGSAPAEQSSPPHTQDRFRVLVLAHRFELLHQAEDKFALMWPGCTVTWVKAGRKEFHGQIVVASVGTAVNCIPQLQRCRFNLVIVDEAHHSVANTYKAVLKGLGFLREELVPVPASTSISMDSSSSSGSLQGSFDEAGAGFAGVVAAAATELEQQQQHGWDTGTLLSDSLSTTSSSSSSSGVTSRGSSSNGCNETGGATSSCPAGSSTGQEQVKLVPVLTGVHTPNSLCVGFTATPYRMRKAESEELYDMFSIVYSRNISDMIRANHLCKIQSRKVLTQVDLKGISSAGGDFVASQLSPVVNSPARNRLVLAAFLDYCTQPGAQPDPAAAAAAAAAAAGDTTGSTSRSRTRRKNRSSGSSTDDEGSTDGSDGDDSGAARQEPRLSLDGKLTTRKAIGFAVDIEHATALDELFTQAGVRSGVVHSKMPLDEVKSCIRAFRNGELDILWNCEKLTEGFDEPSINAVLMARPTKSRGLYVQMLGRGLRKAPGKGACLILDFTDKHHRADTIIDVRVILPEGDYDELDKKPPVPEERDRTMKLDIAQAGRGGEMSVLSEDANPLDYAWKQMGRHWMLSIFSDGTLWLVSMADMGPKQRQQLGLLEANTQQQQQQQQDDSDSEDAFTEDQDDSGYDLQDRFVVLHQPSSSMADPLEWHNVAPQAKYGMTQADAYGAAVNRMYAIIHERQAKEVSNIKLWYYRKAGGKAPFVPTVETFKRDAKWRLGPASERQLKLLSKLGVDLPPGKLTKGGASDLIDAALASLATPLQLRQLQDTLSDESLADLPAPLLQAYAAKLIAPEGRWRQGQQQL